MLTPTDLAVIRAALLFANEELTPHGMDAWRPYFDEPIEKAPAHERLSRLRDALKYCDLRYGQCRDLEAGNPSGRPLVVPDAPDGDDRGDTSPAVCLIFR